MNPQKRKFFLVLPAIAWPFLLLIFHALGGGGDVGAPSKSKTIGLNTELPKAYVDPRRAFLNKLGLYEQAERDSLKKQQYLRQDPYEHDTATAVRTATPKQDKKVDEKADKLLRQLDQLRQTIHHPPPPAAHHFAAMPLPPRPAARDTPLADPQLDRINEMLDKVIRIQNPIEKKSVTPTIPNRQTDAVLPADSTANTIAAVIAGNQTLTTGATIALRILDSIRVNGRLLSGGQLIYGVVSINNDRMLIRIGSLRDDRNLYTTDLQVYDLDGLPGIHIPGALSRDVAKESADQGVSALNLTTLDPSLGAEAATAGIQAAKTFFGRKVRQVRVSVKAGYQVLLRSGNPSQSGHTLTTRSTMDSTASVQPPDETPSGASLANCNTGGIHLTLRTIRMEGGLLWFGLEWTNRSAIAFAPAYTRWIIRDRKVIKRTAVQELPLETVTATTPTVITRDSLALSWTGFKPFTIGKDKQLVLEAGEKNGGRVLQLVIDEKQWRKIKTE